MINGHRAGTRKLTMETPLETINHKNLFMGIVIFMLSDLWEEKIETCTIAGRYPRDITIHI